jgi:uncharacterized protein YdcH (DUF465 family)
MLGESHDILHEFPGLEDKIRNLANDNETFAQLMRQHDQMDAKIRDLELHDQPVGDFYMEDLKKQRAALKDRLYDMIREA